MKIRDRIKEFRRVPAAMLRPNPRNWRTHPAAQRDALRGVLAEIGYADAVLARELPDGSLELVDGHLRVETTPEMAVPVLVLDIDEAEADKLLATLDPLSAMAGSNDALLAQLLEDMETESAALRTMFEQMSAQAAETAAAIAENADPAECIMPAVYQVVVECHDEAEQQTLFERLKCEGLKCRVMML